MASYHSDFQAVAANETRDLSSEKGSVYFLNGNSTNGRLNTDESSRVIFGDDTHAVIETSSSAHSYQNGIIEATRLTYVLQPSGSRLDFGSNICAYQTKDVTFLLLGSGSIFHHLEDNRDLSIFRGITRIVLAQTGGSTFIQFGSKEYPNINLTFTDVHQAATNIYVSRLTNGFCFLTGFKTVGTIDLGIYFGTASTSSGHIIDPIYEGTDNNFLDMQILANNSNSRVMLESFSIDVTQIPNKESARIRVVDSANEVLHNDILLNAANTTPTIDDGVTGLSFFVGRSVILCKVRRITNQVSNLRNTISYKIRNRGYNEIIVDNLSMNSPVVISGMEVDPKYSSNTVTTEINNADNLYSQVKNIVCDDLTMDFDIVSYSGTILIIKSGWLLVRDQSLDQPLLVENSVFTLEGVSYSGRIRVKTGTSGLLKTVNFDTISGSIDDSYIGNTNLNFVKSNGKVDVVIPITENESIESFSVGVWLKDQGFSNRSDLNAVGVVSGRGVLTDLEPNTSYYIAADGVGAYRWNSEFNSGDYGNYSGEITLSRITKPDGTAILPATLSEAQTIIADMLTHDRATNIVYLKLPPNYETYEQWDEATTQWVGLADDFIPYAYKLEQIQSSPEFLVSQYTIRVEDFVLVINSNSSFIMAQHPDNPVGTVINLNAFTIRREGDTNHAQTFVDHSNGAILVNSGLPVIANIDVDGFVDAVETSNLSTNIGIARDHALSANVQTKQITL